MLLLGSSAFHRPSNGILPINTLLLKASPSELGLSAFSFGFFWDIVTTSATSALPLYVGEWSIWTNGVSTKFFYRTHSENFHKSKVRILSSAYIRLAIHTVTCILGLLWRGSALCCLQLQLFCFRTSKSVFIFGSLWNGLLFLFLVLAINVINKLYNHLIHWHGWHSSDLQCILKSCFMWKCLLNTYVCLLNTQITQQRNSAHDDLTVFFIFHWRGG